MCDSTGAAIGTELQASTLEANSLMTKKSSRNIICHCWWAEETHFIISSEHAGIWIDLFSILAHFSGVALCLFKVPLQPWILALQEQDVIQIGQVFHRALLPQEYQICKKALVVSSVLYSAWVVLSAIHLNRSWPYSAWWDLFQPLGQVSGGHRLPCKAWRAWVKPAFVKLPMREKGNMWALKFEFLLNNDTDMIIWGGGETCHYRENTRSL